MSARCKRAVAFLVLLLSSYPIAAHAGPYEDGDAAFRARNYAAAFKLWQPLADDGHAEAQLGVATLYYSGLGVVMDYDLAFEWFSKAAAQGLPRANYMLGAMYRDGRGVREDHDKAIAYLRKAADRDRRRGASLLRSRPSTRQSCDSPAIAKRRWRRHRELSPALGE